MKLNGDLKKHNKDLIKRIEDRLKELERYSEVKVSHTFNIFDNSRTINLEGFKELDISFGDVAGLFGALSGFLLGPLVGVISLLGWFGTKLLGDGGKSKAKAKLSEELRKEKNILKKKIKDDIIERQFVSLEKQILKKFEQLNDVPNEMLIWREKITKSKQEIERLIIK